MCPCICTKCRRPFTALTAHTPLPFSRPLSTQPGIGEQCHVIIQQKLGDHCRNTCHEHLSIAVIAHGLSVRLASVSIAAFLCQNLCYRSNVMTLHRYFEWCHGIRELSLLRHCEIRRMVIRSDHNRSSSSIATMTLTEQVRLLKRCQLNAITSTMISLRWQEHLLIQTSQQF